MDQLQIDLAVARATGESIAEIHRRGFTMANPAEVDFDPEPYDERANLLDWVSLGAERLSLLS